MWLSGQYKRPADPGEGQTGIVTAGGGETAVLLDSERRGLQVYSPAGYRWTPQVGQRVLVIQGRGETPCVVGTRQGGDTPNRVDIEARQVALRGDSVTISAQGGVTIGSPVNLQGGVSINGESLEECVARIVAGLLGGGVQE